MKFKLLIILLFSSFIGGAQGFSGKATYKSHRKVDFKMDSATVKNEAMQKMVQERLKKMYQKTYTLNFNQIESTYKENKKLNTPKAPGGGGRVMVMSFGGGSSSGVLYKNLKENRFANKTDIMSKPLDQSSSLKNLPTPREFHQQKNVESE